MIHHYMSLSGYVHEQTWTSARLTGRRQAQMCLLLGSTLMRGGDNIRAIELFKRAEEAIPFQHCPHLVVVSLVG